MTDTALHHQLRQQRQQILQAMRVSEGISEQALMALGSDVWAEVVDGKVIIAWPEGEQDAMGPVGFLHGLIAANVYDALKPFVRERALGYVLGDGVIYVLARDERGIRSALVPDVAFVQRGRIPPDFDLARPFPGAPDLAVEIISPSDAAADVQTKVSIYLDAGTTQVWVLYPTNRQLHRFTRQDGKTAVEILGEADTLVAGDPLAGLDIAVAALFAVPEFDADA